MQFDHGVQTKGHLLSCLIFATSHKMYRVKVDCQINRMIQTSAKSNVVCLPLFVSRAYQVHQELVPGPCSSQGASFPTASVCFFDLEVDQPEANNIAS